MQALVLIAALLFSPEDVTDYLGKNIADVRVEISGVPATDPAVLALIETRVGEPLGMRGVRGTIDHLVGLGRFEDVRVMADASAQGVTLRWQLTPLKRITKVSVTGNAILPASAIRAELDDRFGALPSANRINDMVTRLQAFYADRGFPQATILPRVQDDDPQPELAELVLTVDAGARTTIGSVNVTGQPLESPAEVERVLGLTAGRPFDQVAIGERMTAYEESLHGRGYYQARVRESHVLAADRSMSVTLSVEPGPHVSLIFAGDPMPEGNREALVPIHAERAVD